jgi:hypothetical protein
MKKLTIAAAAIGLMTIPAAAQTGVQQSDQLRAGQQQPAQQLQSQQSVARQAPAPMQAPGAQSVNPATAVVIAGEVVGQDPDAHIRLQIAREALINEDQSHYPL